MYDMSHMSHNLCKCLKLRSFDSISMLFLYFFFVNHLLGKRGDLKIVPEHREILLRGLQSVFFFVQFTRNQDTILHLVQVLTILFLHVFVVALFFLSVIDRFCI